MAERLIAMQDNNQFQTLCGSFDENLKLLEQRYHVQMICRGDELRDRKSTRLNSSHSL